MRKANLGNGESRPEELERNISVTFHVNALYMCTARSVGGLEASRMDYCPAFYRIGGYLVLWALSFHAWRIQAYMI